MNVKHTGNQNRSQLHLCTSAGLGCLYFPIEIEFPIFWFWQDRTAGSSVSDQ